MAFQTSESDRWPALPCWICLVAVAGCQSGAASGDNAIAGVDVTAPAPPEGKVLQSELRAFCPSVVIRQGTASYNTYAQGRRR